MSIYRMRTEFGHWAKPILYVLAVIFVVGAIWQFGASPGGTKSRREAGSDDTIATVNDLPITRGEFNSVWERVAVEARKQGVHCRCS